MQVTIYGIQEFVAANKVPIKVFHEGKEIIEVPRNQQVTLDVPEGDFLEFRYKKLATEIDVIGKHIILTWNRGGHALYAYVTNSPERILTRLKQVDKKGLLDMILDGVAALFN